MNNTYESPLPVIVEEQILTNSWVKIGATQNVKGYTCIGLYLDIDINDSEDVQIKIVGRRDDDDTVEFLLPVYEVTVEGLIDYAGTYFKLSKNEDQSLIIKTNTDNLIPFIDIYVKVGTVGGTAGKIKSLDISKAWSLGGK